MGGILISGPKILQNIMNHYAITVGLSYVQSNLDISNSDISNSGYLEASI